MAYKNVMGKAQEALSQNGEQTSDIEILFTYEQTVTRVELKHSGKFGNIPLSDDDVQEAFATQGKSLEDIKEGNAALDGRKVNIYGNKIFKYVSKEEIREKLEFSFFDAYDSDIKGHVKSVTFYTENYIYFTVVYDGFYDIDSAPRSPEDIYMTELKVYGGGSGMLH